MATGAITEYIDVAQLALYGFWIFFAGLVVYLQRENMREGYPLITEVEGKIANELLPPPEPKKFHLHDGRTIQVPLPVNEPEFKARQVDGWPGAPYEPTGNPMQDGVGPAAWVMREDVPEMTFHGEPTIVPLRESLHARVNALPNTCAHGVSRAYHTRVRCMHHFVRAALPRTHTAPAAALNNMLPRAQRNALAPAQCAPRPIGSVARLRRPPRAAPRRP